MLLIAHRAPLDAPGCRALAGYGATVFELDVQLVRDVIVVSHLRPVHRRVPAVRRDRLRIRIGSIITPANHLDRALALVPSGHGILLDLKTDRGPGAALLGDALTAAALPAERIYVSSHNWSSLAAPHTAGLRTWPTVGSRRALDRALAWPPPGDAVTVRHTLLDGPVVTALRRRFARVIAWTVNDPARARQLVSWGVEGITSDNPAVLADLSQRTG